jgi:Rap1a immunity proteins
MKYMACIFMLGTFLCYPAAAAQMKLADLYKLCTSSNGGDRSACRFYILGVFEGAQLVGGTVRDKSGSFQEAKDKRFCVPEGLTSAAMELTVKMKMGEDLAVFPEDRDMPAVSFVTALISKQFPCPKTK